MLTGLATELTVARLEWEGGVGVQKTRGWLSPAEPCVLLLGYVTGARTLVGC